MATTLKTPQSIDGELAKAFLASVAKEVIREYADGSETMCPGVSWREAMNRLTVPLRAVADELEARPETRRIATALNDPAASFWLKLALVTALSGDPVDVASDCEHLSALLGERADCMLSQAIEEPGGNPDHESL